MKGVDSAGGGIKPELAFFLTVCNCFL